MIGFVRPKLLAINDDSVKIKIRLRNKTKNHLNSMYFGALAVGADIAAGAHAFYYAKKNHSIISFAFKNIKADFLKRPETDVVFVSNDGLKILSAFEKSKKEHQRVNQLVNVFAYDLHNELVAKFELTASLKMKF